MRKTALAVMICFCSLGSRAQVTPPAVKDIDKMVVFTNIDYNMGRIATGKPLEYNVTIKNISKDTLILKEVKAGCGCTSPKYRTGEKIVPGKSTYITLGFNGDAHGDFTKTADIYFNDGSLIKQAKFHGTAFTDSTIGKPAVHMNR